MSRRAPVRRRAPGASVPASRRYIRACRHCGEEFTAAGARSWLRWYHEHLYRCLRFRERHADAVAVLVGAVAAGVVGIAAAAGLASRRAAPHDGLPLGFTIGAVLGDTATCARCRASFPAGARFCPNDGERRPC